jgi:hypothetical protein
MENPKDTATHDLERIKDTLFNHVTVLSNTGIVAHVELRSILFQQSSDNDGSFLSGVLDDCSCRTGDSGSNDRDAELLVKVGDLEVVEDERCFLSDCQGMYGMRGRGDSRAKRFLHRGRYPPQRQHA